VGRGTYGVVYEAKQRYFPYEVRVIKRINKRKIKNPTSIYSEVHIMSRIDHPHIIKLYDTY
jgi:serine/threonine protein kinase